MGPRPDHIVDPAYDRAAIDLPGLDLLGERQLAWRSRWAGEWTGVWAQCALSQTAFCGAVHLHGNRDNRLLTDLDCNGWPQAGRNEALRILRTAKAVHLCGDQHLAAVVRHGIEAHGDGPLAFTAPALVNTVYGRWWHPRDERPGANPCPAVRCPRPATTRMAWATGSRRSPTPTLPTSRTSGNGATAMASPAKSSPHPVRAGRCRARSPSSAGRGSRGRGPTVRRGSMTAGR
ncbi:MAG: hypothetical protein FJ284_01500 [Planctomycetes bacterium]|nr:hypothetical protein [Planctomycetota bacterium]